MTEPTFACPEAYAILREALIAGLRIVREHEKKGDYIPSHSEFPEMKTFDSGLPQFTKSAWGSDKAPKDYKSIFRDDRTAENPEWMPFYALAKSNEALRRYFDETPRFRTEVEAASEMYDWMVNFRIGYTIEKLLDRYIHLTKKKEFDEEAFAPIYWEWENAVFADKIVFDILVPLVMLTCDFDTLVVADGVCVERMPEPFQLARCSERRFLVSANECVVGADTHALVFQHWYIKNDSHWIRSNNFSNAENFREVIDRVDQFFAALRAVTGVQTGYCQLLLRPDGWCDGGTAHLPQVEIIPLRAYPDHFEQYGWLCTPPVLDATACAEAGKLYTALTTLNKNQLLVASRRLNLALLRSSEQDSIIDVAIGLETLLVEDGAKGEVNHKLAMRLATLCKMRPFEDYKPPEVFGLCKKLYEFRSAVAHGSRDMSKKRVIKVREAREPIEIVVVGTALLRYAIRFLAEKPEFLVPRKLDMSLFGVDDLAAEQAEA